jgi:hypothetical protein
MKFDLEVRYLDDDTKAHPVVVGLADQARWCDHTGESSIAPLLNDVFNLGWAYVAWAGLTRTGATSLPYEEWEATVSAVSLVRQSPGKAPAKSTAKSRRSGTARA